MAPDAGPAPRLPFGGNVGRKSRADGLKPGSPEAKEADRAKDRERKRLANAAKRAATPPPPLPSAPAGQSDRAFTSAATGALGANPPPPDSVGGNAGVPSADSGVAPVAWQPDSLKPLIEQLIEAAEAGRVGNFVSKCAEAGLTGKLVREIEVDAHFPKAAKFLLCRSLPRLSAKYLNQLGLSSEYEDELACVGAVLLIVQNDRKLDSRLVELIEASKPKPAPASNA